jgi:hypothetical protein
MTPVGVYSQRGHEMVKCGSNNSLNYQKGQVLGVEKNGDDILNVVNTRPFSAVDAEHFLCKAWIITKSTFGSSNLSNYPQLCSAHTHPSPVLHAIDNAMIGRAMVSIKDAFYLCNSMLLHNIVLRHTVHCPMFGFCPYHPDLPGARHVRTVAHPFLPAFHRRTLVWAISALGVSRPLLPTDLSPRFPPMDFHLCHSFLSYRNTEV